MKLTTTILVKILTPEQWSQSGYVTDEGLCQGPLGTIGINIKPRGNTHRLYQVSENPMRQNYTRGPRRFFYSTDAGR